MLLRNAPYYGQSPVGTEFYTGTVPFSSLVPDVYPVAINGRGFMLDWSQPFYRQTRRQLAQLLRTQADVGTEPGDQSMDPNSLWRRSFEDWSLGAGQRYLDRVPLNGTSGAIGSVPNGFWYSKGIDALTTKWQISLLPDTTSIRSSANTNLDVVVVGTHIYVIDGQTLAFASSIGGAFTTVTGTPAVAASSICTDGFNVWVAYGVNGVYTTTEGAAGATQYVTSAIDTASVVGYCNGRLMLASTNVLYNIVGAGVLPSPLLTTQNPTIRYVGFAEGNGAIYAGVHAGNHSWIYGMTVTTDGTALGPPVIQGTLPPGEIIASVYGSLSFLNIGSSLGVRMCPTSTSGAVTLGSPIKTPASVQCLSGWDRFVYFGFSAFDGVSSGLGRMDLQNQVIADVLPAYCSDLMVTTQNAIISVAVYNGSPIFAVSGLGFYAPSTTQLVSIGTFQSGYIMYDLTDNKVACLLDIQAVGPTAFGSYSGWVATDAGPFNAIGTVVPTTPGFTHTMGVGPVTGQRFEVQLTLSRDTTTPTKGPVITRWTLRSYPAPKRPRTWQLPLIIDESMENASGNTLGFDPLAELVNLETLATNGQIVSFQESYNSYPVFIQDVNFLPWYPTENRRSKYYNGVALVTLVGLPAQV